MCLYISFGQIGTEGERKQDLTTAKYNDSRFIFTYEVNKLLLRAEVEYMFSGFRFRNRSADPTQAVGGKRPNENDNSRYEEIEQLPEKMGRFELDDSDESSV